MRPQLGITTIGNSACFDKLFFYSLPQQAQRLHKKPPDATTALLEYFQPVRRKHGFCHSRSFFFTAGRPGGDAGLGNIWKFPSLVGQNGGASFLVVYLLASLCIGLPLMISDLSLGCAGRSNVISIFQKLAPAPAGG